MPDAEPQEIAEDAEVVTDVERDDRAVLGSGRLRDRSIRPSAKVISFRDGDAVVPRATQLTGNPMGQVLVEQQPHEAVGLPANHREYSRSASSRLRSIQPSISAG